jgi:SpoVK/Ycf46/Vps4 family AAA+-type ATPase
VAVSPGVQFGATVPLQTPSLLVLVPAVIVGVVAILAIAFAARILVGEARRREAPATTEEPQDGDDGVASAAEPDRDFDDVGGMRDLREALRERVREWEQDSPDSGTHGVLLYGPPGCGKTHLVEALAGEPGHALVEVAAVDLIGGSDAETDDRVESVLASVRNGEPCILFLDGIDAIGSAESATDEGRRLVKDLMTGLTELDDADVFVVAATDRVADLDGAVLRSDWFTDRFEVPPPDASARETILRQHLEGRPVAGPLDYDEVVAVTAGYAANDVELVADLATRHALEAREDIDGTHLRQAAEETDTSLRGLIDQCDFLADDGDQLERTTSREDAEHGTRPRDSLTDVPGMSDLKERLRERVLGPVRDAKEVKSPEEGRNGVLLYGPPGCGKTYLAHAIAAELDRPLFAVTPEQLLAADDPRATLEAIVDAATRAGPSVCLFDDLDAIAAAEGRSAIAPRVPDRLPELLADLEGGDVFVVGTARRIAGVDQKVLDTSPFDERVAVREPDADTREAIVRAEVPPDRFADDFDWERVREGTDGLTARAVSRVASAAARDAITSGYPVMTDRFLEIAEETTTGVARAQ